MLMSLLIMFVGLGTAKYALFPLRNFSQRKVVVPQTKLGWLLQSIQEATNSEDSSYTRFTALTQFEGAPYSAVQEGTTRSGNSTMFGKVHSLSSYAPAVQTRSESASSDLSGLKLGTLPFETSLA